MNSLPNYRRNRLESSLLRHLAMVINSEVKTEETGIITLTLVKLSTDRQYANVSFMILSSDQKIIDKTLKLLTNSIPLLKKRIANQIEHLSKVPELTFNYDEGLAYSNQIEKILTQIKKDNDKKI